MADDTIDQPSGALDAAFLVKPAANKTGMTPVGNIAISPTQTNELLLNMQQMINQRAGVPGDELVFSGGPRYNTIMGSLKDVAAWASGGAKGPTEGLALRDAEKAKEAKDLFDMRTQMAAYKAAQETAAKRSAALGQTLSGLQGGTEGGGGAAAAAPGLTSGGLSADVLARVKQMTDLGQFDEAEKMLNAHISDIGKINRTAMLQKEYNMPDIQIPNPENPNETIFVSVADLERMKKPPTPTAQGLATLQRKNAMGVGAAAPTETTTTKTAPSAGYSTFLSSPAAKIATNLGQTSGEFTPEEMDRLRITEGGKQKFPLNPDTKAMGAYQFTPETTKSLHERGIVFNPYDEKQARAVALNELNRLSKELGSKELALTAYGGFNKKDPTGYVGGILKSTKTGTTTPTVEIATTPTETATPTTTTARVGLSASEKAAPEKAKAAAQETAKIAEQDRKDFKINTNADTLIETDATAKRIQTLVKQFPEISGVINKNDYASAVAGVLKEGIGPVTVKGIEDALFKTSPTTNKESLAARNELATYLARMELQAARLIKGQGQITEGEREILKRASASLDDPAELLYKKARIVERANKKYEDLAAIYGAGEKFADFEKFSQDPEFKRIMKEYKADLNNIMNEKVDFRRLKPGVEATKTTHPPDIQDILKRNQAKKAD